MKAKIRRIREDGKLGKEVIASREDGSYQEYLDYVPILLHALDKQTDANIIFFMNGGEITVELPGFFFDE